MALTVRDITHVYIFKPCGALQLFGDRLYANKDEQARAFTINDCRSVTDGTSAGIFANASRACDHR